MSNETLMPVSKMQVIISNLTSRVKRKLIILDTRVSSSTPLKSTSTNSSPEELLQKTLMRAQSTYSTISGYHDMFSSMSMSSTHSSASSAERATSWDFLDWDLPRIPEEA